MQLLVAPNYLPIIGLPVFLAGPIQGAADWQSEAADRLGTLLSEVTVCSPRRPILSGDFNDAKHGQQVDWETFHLRYCGEHGVVLFWLAAKDHDVPGREYAQTTRFELGEWKERALRGEARLVLGIEDGFSNARYLRRRFAQDCPQVPVLYTLEDTCRAAVELLREIKTP